jgi:hypothetical protein
MKKTTLFFLFLLFACVLAAQDSAAKKQSTGWLIFLPDKIIFEEAHINPLTKATTFFKYQSYHDGIVLNEHYQAESLRGVGKKFKVSAFKSGNEKFKIRLLPVRVKMASSGSSPTSLDHTIFYRKSKEIDLSFRFLNSYIISEIEKFD